MVEEQDIFFSNQVLAFSEYMIINNRENVAKANLFQVCTSKFFKDQFPSMSSSVNKKYIENKNNPISLQCLCQFQKLIQHKWSA